MTKAKEPPALGGKFTISPAPDRRVRHESGALLDAGQAVTWSTHWQRRLDDEDIVLGDTSAPASAAPKKGATE